MADVSRDRAAGGENSKVEGVVSINTMAVLPLASCILGKWICWHINIKILQTVTLKSFVPFYLKARCFK